MLAYPLRPHVHENRFAENGLLLTNHDDLKITWGPHNLVKSYPFSITPYFYGWGLSVQ